MSILLLPFIYVFLKISAWLVSRFHLHRAYISVPYVASLFVILFALSLPNLVSFSLLPELISRIALSIFLFSVGMQISEVMNGHYIKRIVQLIGLAIALILLLDTIGYLFSEEMKWAINSTMFAYNDSMMRKIIVPELHLQVEYWSKIQFIILFLLTPLFLNLAKRAIPVGIQDQNEERYVVEKLPLPFNHSIGKMLIISISAVGITYYFTSLSSLFLFDFVFSMLAGYVVGKLKLKHVTRVDRLGITSWGTWGLYSFIILTSVEVIYLVRDYFSSSLLIVILIKTILFGAISIGVGHWLFRRWLFVDWMVGVTSVWTFTLNAPVACMHSMRTVVNQHGPSPYTLLVVAPVILWLVNYVHLMIYLLLH